MYTSCDVCDWSNPSKAKSCKMRLLSGQSCRGSLYKLMWKSRVPAVATCKASSPICKQHQDQTDSLRFKGPSSSSCDHCVLGGLCRGPNGSLGLLSSGFFCGGEPGRADAIFLSMGDPGWETFLGVKPGGDLIALFTGGSCDLSEGLSRGSSSVGREDPADLSLGEADFLLRLGETGLLSIFPFCFISS